MIIAQKKQQLLLKDFIYIENGQSITIFWQAIICPESCLLAVTFFNQRILRQSPTSTMGLIWPLSTMCKLAWRHQFPAIFPWSLFSKPGKKILNTQRILFKKCMASGIILHSTTSSILVYLYSLHLQITLVKQKK